MHSHYHLLWHWQLCPLVSIESIACAQAINIISTLFVVGCSAIAPVVLSLIP